MEFLDPYLKDIGSLLTWLSKIETNITALQVVQGIAAVLGIILSTLGIYKAWRYAEKRLGRRLNEFLDAKEHEVVAARRALQFAQKRRAIAQNGPTALPTRRELRVALEPLGTSVFISSKRALNAALKRVSDREELAKKQSKLHSKQKAMVHLLLGAVASSEGNHENALANFKAAIELDSQDLEAIEYLGFEYLRSNNGAQALVQFEKLEAMARSRGDALLVSKALRNFGLAQLRLSSNHNANLAFLSAIREFPNTGPAFELALIHELRGVANLRPTRTSLAGKCLEQALIGYSALKHGWSSDAAAARAGLKRVHEALEALKQIKAATSGSQATDDDDDDSSAPTGDPSSQQQLPQQPPDGERPN